MGILTGLLTLPLAPVRGVVWVAEAVAEEAERELAVLNSPQRALAELEAARAAGELSEEEFAEREAELIELALEGRG
jgi:Gas vesicle protein G